MKKTAKPEEVVAEITKQSLEIMLKTIKESEKMKNISKKTEKVDLSEESNFFQNSRGKIIVFNSPDMRIFTSENGNTFYELKKEGFGGNRENFELSFRNPYNEKEGTFERKEDIITMNGEIFDKIDSRKSINVVKIPEVRQEEYSVKLKNW